MAQSLDMDDWHPHHIHAAGAQGWCLSEVGVPKTGHYLEVQHIQDAAQVSEEWGVPVRQLEHDLAAVEIMRTAWCSGEEHAILAYQLLKLHSPSEFDYWNMTSWRENNS